MISKEHIVVIPQQITINDIEPYRSFQTTFIIRNSSDKKLDVAIQSYNLQQFNFSPNRFQIRGNSQQVVTIRFRLIGQIKRADLHDYFIIDANNQVEKRINITLYPKDAQVLERLNEGIQSSDRELGSEDELYMRDEHQAPFTSSEDARNPRFGPGGRGNTFMTTSNNTSIQFSGLQVIHHNIPQPPERKVYGSGQNQAPNSTEFSRSSNRVRVGGSNNQSPYGRLDKQTISPSARGGNFQSGGGVSNYNDTQEEAYQQIIQEKDQLIEKLESQLMIQKERFEVYKIELGEEKTFLEQLRRLLREASPDIEEIVLAAMERQRLESERKNQKILEMFEDKDQAIYEREQMLKQKQNELKDANKQLRDKGNLIEELNLMEQEIKNYKEELNSHQNEAHKLEMNLEQEIHENEQYREKVQLSQSLLKEARLEVDQLNATISELQSREAYWKEYYEQRMQTMKNQYSQIMSSQAQKGDSASILLNDIQRQYADEVSRSQELTRALQKKERQVQETSSRLNGEISVLEEKYKNLSRENMDIKSKFFESEAKNNEDFNQSAGLIKAKEQRINQLEREISQLASSVEYANEQLQLEQKSKKELQVKLDGLLLEQINNKPSSRSASKKKHNQMIREQDYENEQNSRDGDDYGAGFKSEEMMLSDQRSFGAGLSQSGTSYSQVGSAAGQRKTSSNVTPPPMELRVRELEENLQTETHKYVNLHQKYDVLQKRLETNEAERFRLMQEIDLLTRRFEERGGSHSREGASGLEDQNEQIISRLNAQITQLQIREEKLIEESSQIQRMYNDLLEEYNSYRSNNNGMHNAVGGSSGDLARGSRNTTLSQQMMQQPIMQNNSGNMNSGSSSVGSMGGLNHTLEGLVRENQILKNCQNEMENNLIQALNNERLSQKQNQIVERELKQLNQQNQDLINLVDEFERKQDEHERQTRTDINNLERKNAELQNEIYSYERKMSKLNFQANEAENLREKVQIIERVKDKFENDIQKLKANHKEEMQIFVKKIESSEKELQDAQRVQDDLEYKIKQITRNLEDREKNLQASQKEIGELESKYKILMNENEHLNELNRQNNVQIEKTQNGLFSLKDRTESELRKHENVEQKLQDRLVLLQDQLNKSIQEKLTMKHELTAEMERILKTSQENIQGLRAENRDLQQQYLFEIEEKRRDNEVWTQKEMMLNRQIEMISRDVENIRFSSSFVANAQPSAQQTSAQQQSLPGREKSGSRQNSEKKRSSKSRDRAAPNGASGAQESDNSFNNTNSNGFGNDHNFPSSSSATLQMRGIPSTSTGGGFSEDRVRLMEMDLHSKNLQIVQDRHQIQVLNSKLKNTEEKTGQLESELDKVKRDLLQYQQTSEILKKEKDILSIQTKHIQTVDAQIIDELNEFRECLKSLNREKDRITMQMKLKDQEINTGQQYTTDLINFVKIMENQYQTLDLETSKIIQQQKFKNNSLTQQIERMHRQNVDFQRRMDQRDLEIDNLSQEKRESKARIAQLLQQVSNSEYMATEAERSQLVEVNAHRQRMEDLREERSKAETSLNSLQEEMVEQNRKFQETIDVFQHHIATMQEKFQSDLTDLTNRINNYFNQNENVKKSLSPKKEQQYFQKLFETYAEGVNNLSVKEAAIQQVKEKSQSVSNELKAAQDQIQTLTENLQSVQEELNMHKKQNSTFKVTQKTNAGGPAAGGQSSPLKEITDNFVNASGSGVFENGEYEQSQVAEIATLEAQLFTAKTQINLYSNEVRHLKEINNTLEIDVQKGEIKVNEINEERVRLLQQMNEIQKHSKNEIAQLHSIIDNLKGVGSDQNQVNNIPVNSQEMQQLQTLIQEKDATIRDLKDDLNRQKEIIQNVKQTQDEKEYDINTLQTQLETTKEELQKVKQTNKQNGRQDTNFKDFKEKFDTLKNSEKSLTEERNSLNEQVKALKNDIVRKEQMMKELKDKLDAALTTKKHVISDDSENERLKEQIQQMKGEIDRQETNLQNLKAKLDSAINEIDSLQTESINRVTSAQNEIDKEVKKHEHTQIQIRKLENQFNMIEFLVQRIFRENLVNVQKLQNQLPSTEAGSNTKKSFSNSRNTTLHQFGESMNILNLAPEDIDQFLQPEQFEQNQSFAVNSTQDNTGFIMDQFQNELSKENMNVNSIYEMINSLMEERVELQRKLVLE